LHIEHAEFGLDVESTLLGHDQEVAIRVYESFPLHASVREESMDCEAFAKSWISRTRDTLEAGNEVNLAIIWYVEWKPSKLCWRQMHPLIGR
jgi:hypothetical protein|tara:strand:+ start:44737 stop:45012 length:276 start_codon:yes stop_codon:yes gene_type:complete